MDRIPPYEFLLTSLSLKSNQSAFCFDRCIKTEAIGKELSRDQEVCLGIHGAI
jgi:hypothetical protein